MVWGLDDAFSNSLPLLVGGGVGSLAIGLLLDPPVSIAGIGMAEGPARTGDAVRAEAPPSFPRRRSISAVSDRIDR